jgi:hypothetical protein
MPITDIGSYVTTGEEVKSHWTDVNADRVAGGGTALVLAGGYPLATLTTDVAVVATSITVQEDLDNAIALATTNRDAGRLALRDRLIEFRDAVQYRLPGSGYVRALPDTPHAEASEQKFLKALDDMASLWVRINADTGVPGFTPPLLLRGAFALAAFQTQLATLRTNYNAVTSAENDARIGRGQRDVRLDPLRDRFVQYRQAILVEYGPTHPFTLSLPDVYPQPGSTPAAVPLSGGWNAATGQAEFSWPASTNPALAEYELRKSDGSTYDAATATVAGNALPGTQSLNTTAGLAASGDQISCKLFTILSTGNEAGSNTITITRP